MVSEKIPDFQLRMKHELKLCNVDFLELRISL